jgi:hypothetical protein
LIRIETLSQSPTTNQRVNQKTTLTVGLAVVLIATAAFRFVAFLRERRQPAENAYFYDLSARKIFIAPRTSVPPIRGIDNDEPDGMRAVVVSTSGNPKDKAGQKVAYLQKYAPELKQQIEAMQSAHEVSSASGSRISRGAAQSLTFVRRLSDETWYPVNSAEAEKIMAQWQVAGSEGTRPVVCVP